jgi:hypothetical protein
MVLHITFKPDPQTSKANYDEFYKVITSYRWVRLSESHWTIDTEERPKAVWQKLKTHIDRYDCLVMLPLDASSLSSQDLKALQWVLRGP